MFYYTKKKELGTFPKSDIEAAYIGYCLQYL